MLEKDLSKKTAGDDLSTARITVNQLEIERLKGQALSERVLSKIVNNTERTPLEAVLNSFEKMERIDALNQIYALSRAGLLVINERNMVYESYSVNATDAGRDCYAQIQKSKSE